VLLLLPASPLQLLVLLQRPGTVPTGLSDTGGEADSCVHSKRLITTPWYTVGADASALLTSSPPVSWPCGQKMTTAVTQAAITRI
jgi:hypothetical protein